MYRHLGIDTIAVALGGVGVSRFLSVALIVGSGTRALIITTVEVLNMLGPRNTTIYYIDC
jgi:hypothetical protein